MKDPKKQSIGNVGGVSQGNYYDMSGELPGHSKEDNQAKRPIEPANRSC